MTITLTSVRDQVETRLQETANLIFSTDTIDEALRGSLYELSSSYGAAQTLSGLDGASSTTFEDQDLNTLILGAVAYALRFRLVGKFEEASPIHHLTKDDPPVFLYYPQPNEPLPPNPTGRQYIHHPKFGFLLKKEMDALGIACVVKLRADYAETERTPVDDCVAFFKEKLLGDK